jgi:septal ring factor EnvC (AmiA/AmiB activator)
LSINYFFNFHIGIHVYIYYFTAAEQAEIQKTIDQLKTEVDKRDASIKQLQTSLKEAETILLF